MLPVSLCPLRVHVGHFPQVEFGDGTELPLLSLNCCLLTLQLVSGWGGQATCFERDCPQPPTADWQLLPIVS